MVQSVKKLIQRVHHFVTTKPSARQLTYLGLGVLGFFVILNLVVLFVYRGQTYPKLVLNGHKVGNRSKAELSQDLDRLQVLPPSVTLKAHDKTVKFKTVDLGISTNKTATIDSLFTQRSWLPILNLWAARQGQLVTTVDQTKLNGQEKALSEQFNQAAVDATLVLNKDKFEISDQKNGYQLDWGKSRQAIIDELQKTQSKITLVTTETKPKVSKQDLEAPKQTLTQAQATTISLIYNGQTKTATTQQIGSWYKITGTSTSLDQAAVRNFITATGSAWGIRVQNSDTAMAAISSSLQSRKALKFTIVAAPKARKTYSYCIAAKGVDASNLAGLSSKLASTYSDGRGWGLSGDVSFVEVKSGCNFTVWLTAAPLMSTFGAICDSLWSCAVSPNVIINFDRWTGASAAWNAAGGSLDNYRSMVINHETGHWLGFGHSFCPGAGQPAPVMQQQSISLQGCSFNPWPTASEQASLRRTLGL